MRATCRNLVLLCLGSALTLAACGGAEPEAAGAPPPRPVKTLTVGNALEAAMHEFSGVVDADRKVDLAFRVKGKLVEVDVREGDRVEAGATLARLDTADYRIRVQSTQAEMEQSRAEYERAGTLVEQNLISRSDFDKLTSQFKVAEAAYNQARKDLEYATLKAPFGGYIAARHVENYTEVGAGTPILTLMDLDTLTIAIDIPEGIMITINRNTEVPYIYATFQGVGAREFPLALKEVSPQADPVSRTYRVTLAMDLPEGINLLPGMSGRVHVRRPLPPDEDAAIFVPAHAVQADAHGRFVWVVNVAADGSASVARREVGTGELSAEGIRVSAGLAPGERIVVAGLSQVHEGMAVRLMEDGA